MSSNPCGFDEHGKNWAVVEDGVAIGNVGASASEFRHETAWVYYARLAIDPAPTIALAAMSLSS